MHCWSFKWHRKNCVFRIFRCAPGGEPKAVAWTADYDTAAEISSAMNERAALKEKPNV